MKLKDHIERFEESLLDEKVNKPTSKNVGMLTEHIARFEESLGETPSRKSTSKEVIFSHVEQLKLEIRNKDKIIEDLKSKSSDLTKEVLTLEQDKSMILEELSRAKWLENKVTSNSKKIYEDKIKRMSYVDSTKLIPTLIEVSREKQGNTKLNWGQWLETPENIYLFQINESIARKVFEDTNNLIDRKIGLINQRRTRLGDAPTVETNYSLKFAGDTGASAGYDYVSTTFNPDDFNLNLGFTVSYWIKPSLVHGSGTQFAIGRQAGSGGNQRFMFGIDSATTAFIGVGANRARSSWKALHLPEENLEEVSRDFRLRTDQWYHFVVTYGDRNNTTSAAIRRIYINGVLRQGGSDESPPAPHDKTTGVGSINWSQTGGENGQNIYFGARNHVNSDGDAIGYSDGFHGELDQVAIYDGLKDHEWVEEVYAAEGTYDHSSETKSDRPSGGSQRGLVGYWKFNDGGGTTVEDLSGFGNHGTFAEIGTANAAETATVAALPTWGEGSIAKSAVTTNYALKFTGDPDDGDFTSGTSDYVATTFDPIEHELNDGFSISFWVRPDEISTGAHQFFIGRRDNSSHERFTFGLNNQTRLYVGVGAQKKTYNNHGMTAGTWYHWVITFAGGSGGALKAYRDGVDIELNNSGGSGGDATSIWTSTDESWPIYFGARNAMGDYDNGSACTLDEVSIFSAVLNQTSVTNIYNYYTNTRNNKDGYIEGINNLVGYWRFDEGSGTTVTDLSGNDNHGTLTAGTGNLPTWEER